MDSPISTPRGVSGSRGLSSPLRCGVRPASPSKLVTSYVSSPSRGMMSPSRVRNGGVASTVNNDLGNTPSILSFAADALAMAIINARADNAMMVQKVTAERSLYNGWVATSKLLHSIKTKRIELQLLRQNLMLYSILKGQILYLDDWDLIDWDHSNSLSGAIEALESSTLRLPIVGGARADTQNVKDAICSAVDVMQSMASSICSLLTKVDQVNPLLSELANTTAKERALLDQCKDLLSTLTAMQLLYRGEKRRLRRESKERRGGREGREGREEDDLDLNDEDQLKKSRSTVYLLDLNKICKKTTMQSKQIKKKKKEEEEEDGATRFF
ncbi:hypothetical protein HYC85_020580 [Camellia sinensis]|uniref:Uncharacterized protein n=1 Tax=Camellia sinensis TaxID=4442 RepID=A0A7J7GU22_CAMSI|nr:hypothetical protein HYC85_020580 [Camellia sinensis]